MIIMKPLFIIISVGQKNIKLKNLKFDFNFYVKQFMIIDIYKH